MKPASFIAIALLFLISNTYAQDLHSPAEIIKIMTDSKVSYSIEQLKKPIECMDRSDKLNYNNLYRTRTGKGFASVAYSPTPEAMDFFKKAEKYFTASKSDSALFYYKKAVETDTGFYMAYTYAGQVHGQLVQDEEAIKCYKKAIEHNYIDYMAHWFLADIYKMHGKINEAVDEVTIAWILNRNNPRLINAAKQIYAMAKMSDKDFCFTPQVEIEKMADGKIRMAYGDDWLAYAMVKAVWAHEPGYSKSMGVEEGTHSSLEDREALISQYVGIKNAKKKIKNMPEFKTLEEAIEAKLLDGYLFFEVMLPETPMVAYQLPQSTIEVIKDYVIKVRQAK